MGTTVLELILWVVCDEILEVKDIDYETASSKRELKNSRHLQQSKEVHCVGGMFKVSPKHTVMTYSCSLGYKSR